MERLRHVARSGDIDPAVVVAETADALTRLGPAPSELVALCRNLVERNPTCGPLWWLCAHLLANPDSLGSAWQLAEEVIDDPTAKRLGDALAVSARVLTVGSPRVVVNALAERPDLCVSVIGVDDAALGAARRLERRGVAVEIVSPEATLIAARQTDVVLVEASACSIAEVVATLGGGLAAVAASAVGVPVWLVAGVGRRLPPAYVEAISCGLDPQFEQFSTTYVSKIASPTGVAPMTGDALAAECPVVPELLP